MMVRTWPLLDNFTGFFLFHNSRTANWNLKNHRNKELSRFGFLDTAGAA